jgi:RNA polymerase sigma-70 factor (ECF subfamily)
MGRADTRRDRVTKPAAAVMSSSTPTDGGAMTGSRSPGPGTTDAELLRRARTDAGAFRELYERHAVAVHAFHLRRCRDPHAAQDLTAETFAQAWLARGRFRDRAGGSAGPWLFGIARNVLRASVRARRIEEAARVRIGLASRIDQGPPAAPPDESWLEDDDVLDGLPAGQREAIRMHVVDEVPYDVAAIALDVTPEALRARVSRGLRALRHSLVNGESR